jgi:cytoskeletal protein RodZ
MKTKFALGAVAAAIAVFSQGAFAQTATTTEAPKTRAEVKSEAKTGSLAPAGQGPIASQPSKMSDKSRDERKATTKADRASGALKPAGEAGDLKGTQPTKGSTTDRAERKADTKAAVKSRTTQPAGESPQPAAEKPMK